MQILNKSLHLFKNAQTKKDAQQLYDNLEKIRQERNHITHGLWGWYNPDHDRYEAAALSHKVHPPFHHSKLVAHHNAVAEETHRVVKIFTDLTGLTVGTFLISFSDQLYQSGNQIR